jgi:tetratricopeptide (TPR) repeat protein
MIISRFALALVILTTSCTSKWRASFDKGTEAFRHARYVEAAQTLEQAAAARPDSVETRIYLANAYLKQYKAGSPTAKKAEVNLRKALEIEPSNKPALLSLAWLEYNEAQSLPRIGDKLAMLDRAAEVYRKLASIDPQDMRACYWLGVIAWLKGHERLMQARVQLHLEPEDVGPLPDEQVRRDLGPLYDDAVKQLSRALEIDPASGDAMVFMSLCLREKADLAASDDDYALTLKQAGEWSEKARSAKTAKAASGSLTP